MGQGADFDDNGNVGVSDIDILFAAIDVAAEFYGDYVVGTHHDINYDGVVDDADMDYLIQDIIGTEYGDANLDGYVNQLDLDIVKEYWQTHVDTWANGDFNGDGFVDVTDLLLVALNFGFIAGWA